MYVISIILPLKSRQPLLPQRLGFDLRPIWYWEGVPLNYPVFYFQHYSTSTEHTHFIFNRSCYKNERANPGSQYIKQMLFQKSVALEIKVQLLFPLYL